MACRSTTQRSTRRMAAIVLAWLVLAPALSWAADRDGVDDGSGSSFTLLTDHGWRFVPLSQMLEQSQRQRIGSRGMPRLLPLATLPMQQSALWLGLSTARGEGARDSAVRFELRWSIPLDRIGGTTGTPAFALR